MLQEHCPPHTSDFLFHTVKTKCGHQRPLSFQGSSSTLSQMGPLTATCSNCYSYLIHWIYSSLHLCSHFICSEATYHGRYPFLSSQKVLENAALDCLVLGEIACSELRSMCQVSKLTSRPTAQEFAMSEWLHEV